MKTKYQIMFVTFSDKKTATKCVRQLLKKKRIACGTVISGAISIYRWKGKICKSFEVVCMLKTRADMFSLIERDIKHDHPYDTPEIIGIDISHGSKSYLNWIRDEVSPL